MPQSNGQDDDRAGYISVTAAVDRSLAAILMQRLPPQPSVSVVISTAQETLEAFWGELTPLMGHAGARAVFGRALRVSQRQAPHLRLVRVNDTSLDLSGVESAGVPQSEAPAVVAAMVTLAMAVEEALVGLIGAGLVQTLVGEVFLALTLLDTDLEPAQDLRLSEDAAKAGDPIGEDGLQRDE